MPTRQLRLGPLAVHLALAAWPACVLAAGEAPVLRPGETVRLEMPQGDPEKISVTLELQATEDGPLTVETSTLYFDTLLKVFEADAADVQPLAEDDDGGVGGAGANSRLTFEAAAGRSYRVEVRGSADEHGGPFEISAARGAVPALDAEERRRRDAEYWDVVAAEGQRTGSAILESRGLTGRGSLHFQAGEYASARPLLERALAIREKAHGPEHPDTALGLTNLAVLLKAMGEYASARPLYERALAIYEKVHGPEHPNTATSLNNLAELLRAMGEYASARPLYERALAIREKVHGPEHPTTAQGLNNLAELLRTMGEYASARPLYERALAIYEKVYGPEHPYTALGLNNLANLLQSMGEYASARPLCERALAILEKVNGPEHPETATSLNNLAVLLWAMGDYASARPLYERALAIREKALGPEHPTTVLGLGNLAQLLRAMGEYTAARPLYERALAVREKVHGPEHPDTAVGLYNLAALLTDVGEYASARPLFERALAIREKALGPEHPDTAASLNNLALLLQAMGEYASARPLFERALAIRERVHGPEHPETATSLNSLALLLQAMGEYASARPLFERALAIREKALGPEHPHTAAGLVSLAGLLQGMGEYASARPLFERALAIREKVHGPEHPQTATGLNNLAALLQAMGEYASARPLCERALAIREKALGPEHRDTAGSLNNLAMLLRAMGEYTPARPLYERAVAIYEKVHGPEHPDTALGLNNLAGLLQATGEYASARPLFERALAIREKALGPEHPDTAASLNNLAMLLQAMGEYASARPLFERALAIWEKVHGHEHPYTATSLNNLASSFRDTGEYASARPLYEHALAIREKTQGPEHPETAKTLAGLAALYRALSERGPAMEAALRAETIGAAHLAKTARTMSEEGALRYAAVRPRGLALALTLLATGGADVRPQAVEVWEAAMATRGQVLDEVASRRQRLNATVRAARELGQAAGDLANLMVRGAGAPELEAARRRQERAEQAVARSTRAGSEPWARPALREVALGLPTDAALVAFVRYDRLPPSSEEKKSKATPSYAGFVLNKGETNPAFVDLGSAEAIDGAVLAWKREASRGAVEAASAGEALARYRAAGEALRKLVWDPLAPHLARARKIFVVADGALQLVSFAALPSGEAGYLIEAAPWIHYLSAERDLIARPGAAEKTEGLLALGGPSFDEASLFAALGKKKEAGDGAVLLASAGQAVARDVPTFRGERSGCADFRELRFEALPGTAREAEEIVGLWRTRERPSYLSAGQAQEVERSLELEGAAASETAFKAQAHGHRVLHLATHGFFLGSECASAAEGSRGIGALAEAESPAAVADDASKPAVPRLGENPLRLSGLALAGANRRDAAGPGEDDGILTAEEIAALDLSGTEWVVLSACDTGVGDIKAGEGVFGLRRAFQVAGAGTLVMSLWSVDDEATRSWMKALYDARLNKRMDTAEAVRTAGLAVLEERRKGGESTHPFYWAAFVAAGDWR